MNTILYRGSRQKYVAVLFFRSQSLAR